MGYKAQYSEIQKKWLIGVTNDAWYNKKTKNLVEICRMLW